MGAGNLNQIRVLVEEVSLPRASPSSLIILAFGWAMHTYVIQTLAGQSQVQEHFGLPSGYLYGPFPSNQQRSAAQGGLSMILGVS